MNPEREVEIKLWDWLMCRSHSVQEVFFNSKNEVGCRIFKVKGLSRKIPDLVVKFINPFTRNIEYMVIEVKDASISKNVRDGKKVYEEYLLNYLNNETKYFIEDKEIKIDHFSIATQFSEEGHLKKNESPEFHESLRGNTRITNKIVPSYEFSGTCEIYRGMVGSFSSYRKKHNLKGVHLPSIGILISDVIINLDKDEIERQPGMKGKPIYQAVTFNKNKKRWSQCLMKI